MPQAVLTLQYMRQLWRETPSRHQKLCAALRRQTGPTAFDGDNLITAV